MKKLKYLQVYTSPNSQINGNCCRHPASLSVSIGQDIDFDDMTITYDMADAT
jgi:hypothetical protein